MVAIQESGIRNLDHGHADSLGLMQQRPSMGWGTPAQLQNPQYAIQAFYFGVNGNGNPGLMHLENWDTMIPTVAADRVQRSAYPNAYGEHLAEATRLIEKYKSSPSIPVLNAGALNTSAGGAHSSGSTTCPVGGTPGSITATGDDYPGRNWVPDVGSVAGGLARECVDFAAWRMRQLTPGFDSSNPFFGTWYVLGHGKLWGPSAAAAGYTVDRSAKAGDIAYWDNGQWGHVAFVTAVHEDGTVDLEEYNWVIPGGGGASDYSYHTRTISSAEPAGYIHFLDNPKHPMVPYAQSQVP
jgi:surface antigen